MKNNPQTHLFAVLGMSLAALVLVGCASTGSAPAAATAGGTQLTAAPERITDRAIFQDMGTYDDQQARIKALNDSGRHRVSSYSLAKAQCWLDVSLHEYSRNDRGGFPQAALSESFKITDYLEKGGVVAAAANPANTTPSVNEAAKLRPDLWDAAAKLKGHPGWRCAEQKTACAEVELVHAGNEFNQQQWRHAKPYVQIAEDLIGDAQRAAEACIPAPAPAAALAPRVVPPAPIVAPPAPVVPVNAAANVLFNFDKRDLGNVRPYTKDQLDSLIAQVKGGNITVTSIKLVGHADRLNSTGDANYNTKLSQDRVETIRAYMVSQGVPANLISTEFRADSQQIEACTKAKFRSNAELQECLLPNRRVEVLLSGVRK
ncbi:OmpA family protein [Variovorax sp. PCZ-1]|uniref:OmpA family protein n=1 Tax=Variovorax sp. PCZ-1 TaxID=2835533 RepID=UPI001BCE4DB3|nr:OmpA family protein [Variovorax sp. PCZ-1]MBS7808706.1 OmpA family protein [Variovorax sp. PCZ-1]